MDTVPARSSSSKLPHCIKSLHLNTKEHRSHNLCFPKMCPPPNGYKNLNSLLLERACTLPPICKIAPEGAVHGSLAQCPPGGLGHPRRLRLTPGPTLPLWMSLTRSLYPASPPSPARARIRAHCSNAGAPSLNWPGDSSPPLPPPLVCLAWHHILADIPAPILLWPGHAVPWPVRLPSTSRSKTCDLHDPYFA